MKLPLVLKVEPVGISDPRPFRTAEKLVIARDGEVEGMFSTSRLAEEDEEFAFVDMQIGPVDREGCTSVVAFGNIG